MRVLSGAVTPDEGEVIVYGEKVMKFSPHGSFDLGIRTVYQEFSQVSHLSVAENILMGKMPYRRFRWLVDWEKAFESASEILENLGFPGIDVRTRISDLSVSQQQVVEIAKAITETPRILILDEPSAVLAETELRQLFALIERLKNRGTLILYISHRLKEVFEIADRITVLKDGEKVETLSASQTDEQGLVNLMVGRPLSKLFPEREGVVGEPVLEVKDLEKNGEFRDISFNLKAGEILGMFGLVGSGRTAIARALFGASRPDSGTVVLEGKSIWNNSPQDGVASGIAYLTRDRKVDGLVLCDSIKSNMTYSTLKSFSKGIFLDTSKERRRVSKMVEQMAIKPKDYTRLVREQSGGNQQKVLLSRWLLTESKVLILNEPTRGVDVNTKVEIYRLIMDLAAKRIPIIMISSELPEIIGLSDRALVLRNGRIVNEFPKTELNEVALLASASGVSMESEKERSNE